MKNHLDDAFNITPTQVEVDESDVVVGVDREKPDRLAKDDITKDYEYTRGNLYSIIEKGQEAINGILELAQESEMPRAYEVAGQLIKTVGETAEKLIDLQQKMKVLEKEDTKIRDQHNHLYVGSTSELQKFLKKNNGTSEE